jgi:hypothetical protein
MTGTIVIGLKKEWQHYLILLTITTHTQITTEVSFCQLPTNGVGNP